MGLFEDDIEIFVVKILLSRMKTWLGTDNSLVNSLALSTLWFSKGN